MTRDEAVEWLNDIIQRSADCDKMSIDDERLEAITVARDVLEAMAPDTETGLMPCGCGGKAKIWPSNPAQFTHVITDYDLYSFECIKCETGTLFFNTKEDAKNAWNRAMGYADAVQGQ